MGYTPGWYPDPAGVHELRYHNGQIWTGDVSTDGERRVAPLPTAPTHERTGTLALVLGVIAMCIGLIPFVCVAGMGAALAAIVIGVRRRRIPSASGAANAGIVTGTVGLLFAVAGIWLSIVVVRAVDDYDDPGPHDSVIEECAEVDGVTRATGSITNQDDRTRSYTVVVAFDADRTADTEVDDVAAGETVEFVVNENYRFSELDCSIDSVKGPRPFGIGSLD